MADETGISSIQASTRPSRPMPPVFSYFAIGVCLLGLACIGTTFYLLSNGESFKSNDLLFSSMLIGGIIFSVLSLVLSLYPIYRILKNSKSLLFSVAYMLAKAASYSLYYFAFKVDETAPDPVYAYGLASTYLLTVILEYAFIIRKSKAQAKPPT